MASLIRDFLVGLDSHRDGTIAYGLLQKKEFEEALLAAEQAYTKNPQAAYAWNNAGYALQQMGHNEQAIPRLQRAIQLDPYTLRYRTNLLQSFLALKRYDDLLSQCAAALERFPDAPSLLNYQGIAYEEQNQYDDAERAYLKAISRNRELPGVWNNLGQLYLAEKRDDEALECFERAINLSPKWSAAWRNKVTGLFRLRRYQRALDVYDEMPQLEADDLQTLHIKGLILFHLGRTAEGIEVFNAILARAPRHMSALINKGHGYYQLGLYEQALALFQESTAGQKDPYHGLASIAFTLMCLGRFDEAVEPATRAHEMGPEVAFSFVVFGKLHEHLGEYDEALAAINQAIDIEPDESSSWFVMGELLVTLGEHAKAPEVIEHALTLDPYDIYPRRLKAKTLRALSREEEAAPVERDAEQFVAEQLALIEDNARRANQGAPEPPSRAAKRSKWD